MPNYSSEKQNEFGDLKRVTPDDIKLMLSNVDNLRDAFIISLSYLVPVRPIELQELHRRDIIDTGNYLQITLYTAKLQKANKSFPKQRIVRLKSNTPFIQHIRAYINTISNPDYPLVSINRQQIWRVIDKSSNGKYCPYNLRHSRINWLMENDVNLRDILRFKGGTSLKSLQDYYEKHAPIGEGIDLQ